jgi:hypothetical protein
MAAIGAKVPEAQTPPPRPIPPLENAGQLTRAEFERRDDAMPNIKKAELIEGVVNRPSPLRFGRHSGVHVDLIMWMEARLRLASPEHAAFVARSEQEARARA